MAKGQGRVERTGSEEDRSKARESSAAEAAVDPRAEVAARAVAQKGRGVRGRPAGGKGRDHRALREGRGANAQRGDAPDVDAEEDEEKDEEKDEFWKDLVGEAYRSRKRRGDWKETEFD